jgi:hypothetical protein
MGFSSKNGAYGKTGYSENKNMVATKITKSFEFKISRLQEAG